MSYASLTLSLPFVLMTALSSSSNLGLVSLLWLSCCFYNISFHSEVNTSSSINQISYYQLQPSTVCKKRRRISHPPPPPPPPFIHFVSRGILSRRCIFMYILTYVMCCDVVTWCVVLCYDLMWYHVGSGRVTQRHVTVCYLHPFHPMCYSNICSTDYLFSIFLGVTTCRKDTKLVCLPVKSNR